jgi:hypothetical protein
VLPEFTIYQPECFKHAAVLAAVKAEPFGCLRQP